MKLIKLFFFGVYYAQVPDNNQLIISSVDVIIGVSAWKWNIDIFPIHTAIATCIDILMYLIWAYGLLIFWIW